MQLLFILPLDTISAQDKHVRKGDTSTPTLPKAFFFLLSPQNEYNLHPQGTIQTLKSLRAVAQIPQGSQPLLLLTHTDYAPETLVHGHKL